MEIRVQDQIWQSHQQAQQLAHQSKEKAREAIDKAVECGNLLMEQKGQVKFGQWLGWLEDHLPELSYETASRYMRLAKGWPKLSRVTTSVQSLGQAYRALGILGSKQTTRIKQQGALRYVRYLDQLRRWYRERTEQDELEQWTPQARELLKQELQWVWELYQQL